MFHERQGNLLTLSHNEDEDQDDEDQVDDDGNFAPDYNEDEQDTDTVRN